MDLIAKSLAGVAFSIVSTLAYAQQSERPISAVVNGEPVFQGSVNIISEGIDNSETMDDRDILTELINLKILSQAARDIGLDKNNDVVLAINLQTEQALANAYTKFVYREFDVSENDIKAEYQRQVVRLDRRDYRVSHVLVAEREEADAVVREIELGANFDDLVSVHSIDPITDKGGDIGWMAYGSNTIEHSEAIEQLAIGENTEPYPTSFGWHVFKLTDIRGSDIPKYENIRDKLYGVLIKEQMLEHLETLRSKAVIDLVER